ncbi:MAG TPA: hypothetical protein VF559_06610 [Caulobacteraceae bacterium]|jgi:hypothetical protein
MSDNYEDREVRTTTTGPVGDPTVTGPATHTTTTSTASTRRGGSGMWMILGLIALLAIVGLVYMASQRGGAKDATDVNVNLPSAPAAGQAVENATESVGNAAEGAADAVGNAAEGAGNAAENAADNATNQ